MKIEKPRKIHLSIHWGEQVVFVNNMRVKAAAIRLGLGLILASLAEGSLEIGFYRGKCGLADVELVVAGVVSQAFFRDPTIVAALLRLHFHDCFVRGCDASILLDGNNSEKRADANKSLRGFEIIDEAKKGVDRFCPALVSCADLIALVTRDAVFLSGGGRYEVPTGRRDGFVSSAENVTLPSPFLTVPQNLALFANKGLTPLDMVLLLGAHSVGVTHCSFIRDRLYNFRNTGNPDPSMDQSLVQFLRSRCPRNATADPSVNLNQMTFSPTILDNTYYRQAVMRRAILPIDQALAFHPLTRPIVTTLARAWDFRSRFGAALVKMGTIGVLTGQQGEIRRSCRAVNMEE